MSVKKILRLRDTRQTEDEILVGLPTDDFLGFSLGVSYKVFCMTLLVSPGSAPWLFNRHNFVTEMPTGDDH